MDWLNRLFRREGPWNPEEYERVRCDVCGGTGRSTTFQLGRDFTKEGLRQPCGKCRDKGWLMVKREDL